MTQWQNRSHDVARYRRLADDVSIERLRAQAEDHRDDAREFGAMAKSFHSIARRLAWVPERRAI